MGITCERQFEERLRQERLRFARHKAEMCTDERRQRERFTEWPEIVLKNLKLYIMKYIC